MRLPLSVCVSLAFALTGCDDGTHTEAAADARPPATADHAADHDDRVLARVGDVDITEAMLELHMVRRTGGRPERLDPDERETLLLELVEMELIGQDAERQGLDREPEIRAQLENVRRALLTHARVRQIATEPVQEDAVRELYHQRMAGLSHREFHARHILLHDEDHAWGVIGELEDGADFATLARQHSLGMSSLRGGDLGWFPPEQMSQPFSEALLRLRPGEYTEEPVRTRSGWHVIMVVDERSAEPPRFSMLRESLAAELVEARIEAYLEDLRQEADVTLYRLP